MTSSLSRQNLGFDFESPVYRFGPLQTTASNALCVPIIYGQVKAAGNKIWQGAGSKTFYALIAFGEGPISGISNVKINDYVVPSKDLPGCAITAYVGDGTKDIYSEVTGANNKPLADNAARAAIVGGLRHTAYLGLKVTVGTKVTRSYMNVTADIKGKLVNVYTNPLITPVLTYSNNPAWCILDFLTSSSGCAMSTDSLDIQSFINTAAYCDAKVGSETDPRFTLNLILDQRKSRLDWLNQMLVTCRGELTYNADNKLSLVIEKDADVAQDFTLDDINDVIF